MAPNPTYIYRILHLDNLEVYLKRHAIHAPNHTPLDGLIYRTIHNFDVQTRRMRAPILCNMGQVLKGVIHDYVPFYFGPLSPMLLQLKTGKVEGYTEGQKPLIYVVSSVQAIVQRGLDFVFSDGHGVVAYTKWYDDLNSLDKVDWNMVNQRYWSDNSEDGDRKRRKQAEFLVFKQCPWDLIQSIGVLNEETQLQVEELLARFSKEIRLPVYVKPDWYY